MVKIKALALGLALILISGVFGIRETKAGEIWPWIVGGYVLDQVTGGHLIRGIYRLLDFNDKERPSVVVREYVPPYNISPRSSGYYYSYDYPEHKGPYGRRYEQNIREEYRPSVRWR